MIYINEETIEEKDCEPLIDIFFNLPEVEVEVTGENQFLPKMEDWENKSYKFWHPYGKRVHGVLQKDKISYCYAMVKQHLPKNFGDLNYAELIYYPEGGFMEWHKDTTDSNDKGTAMVFLNDNYLGGNLNVSGHRLITKQGTTVAFENSTEVFHGVEPVYKGERFVFALWFGKA